MTEGFVDVAGGRLYYRIDGEGDPVVFVHGFTLDHRMWDDQVAAFAGRYRVVRYDARGFGRSSLPTGEYRPHDDLRDLMAALGIARAHVIGLSMGGGIAADFAIAHPAMVERLVLVDAAISGYTWPEGSRTISEGVYSAARAGDLAAARAAWLASPLFGPAREDPRVAAALEAIVGDYSGWHWQNEGLARGIEPGAGQRLAELTAPTLVVVGERDLPVFHDMARHIAGGPTDARVVVIPGAGHMANMEAPDQFAELVLPFLEGRG